MQRTSTTMEDNKNKTEKGGIVEFEDAVSLTGYGLYNISLLFVCGGLLMAVIMETMSMSYILPAAQCDLDLTLSDKSILSAVSFLGVVLSSLLWGFIGDTIGRRNVVIITTYISFIMTFLSAFSPYTWPFIILRFLNGFFIGGPSAVTYAYLGEFHNNSHRARVLSWAAAFIAVAMITLPAMAWLVLPMQWSLQVPGLDFAIRPWRLLVILYGLPGVLSATCLLRYPESPKFLWVNGNTEQTLVILREMYQRNTGNPKSMYSVTRIAEQTEKNLDAVKNSAIPSKKAIILLKSMWEQTAPLFRIPLILKTFMTCTLQFGVFASSSGFLMWTPDILNKVSFFIEENPTRSVAVCEALDYSKNNSDFLSEEESMPNCSDFVNEEVFKISLILGSVFAMGYIIIGLIINVTGKKLLLVILLTVSGLSGLSVTFVESYEVIVTMMGLFLMAGCCVGIINTVVVDLYPTQYRAMAMAISLMMGRFGAVIGSHIVGMLLEYSCQMTIYIFAGEYIGLMILSLLLPVPLIIRRTKLV